MHDAVFLPRPALGHLAAPGRHGVQTGPAGLLLEEAVGMEIVSIAARRGQDASVIDAVAAGWGVELPTTPRVVEARGVAFLWSGAGQWLALANGGSGLEAELRRVCGAAASLTAQGDGRFVLRLAGPAVRDILASVLPIDLHPRAFRSGSTAMTLLNHVGVQIRQLDDSPRYELLAFRGYAASVFETVLDAGLRFGIDVRTPG